MLWAIGGRVSKPVHVSNVHVSIHSQELFKLTTIPIMLLLIYPPHSLSSFALQSNSKIASKIYHMSQQKASTQTCRRQWPSGKVLITRALWCNRTWRVQCIPPLRKEDELRWKSSTLWKVAIGHRPNWVEEMVLLLPLGILLVQPKSKDGTERGGLRQSGTLYDMWVESINAFTQSIHVWCPFNGVHRWQTYSRSL